MKVPWFSCKTAWNANYPPVGGAEKCSSTAEDERRRSFKNPQQQQARAVWSEGRGPRRSYLITPTLEQLSRTTLFYNSEQGQCRRLTRFLKRFYFLKNKYTPLLSRSFSARELLAVTGFSKLWRGAVEKAVAKEEERAGWRK
ncbi:hypothetical protein KOW79_022611 [Hemibagrus wyckioides]|uniref:Uncharacterized protein n=1 Tax=Hemibagrus wyckioides TaxID=337641 RepID=A0A9D3N430_9TELE|nr:hypothetical protein KOW79_022611 [Hemibagrus wyckioides]